MPKHGIRGSDSGSASNKPKGYATTGVGPDGAARFADPVSTGLSPKNVNVNEKIGVSKKVDIS